MPERESENFNFTNAPENISPLVLDLDGDGVELTALAGSTAMFDLDADGFAELTGWVTGGDGILAIDSNGDGVINDINEVFGNATTDGFTELAALDSNSDSVIDSSDTQFDDLRVWVDANEDGVTDSGELKTLAEHNIASIDLAATQTGTYDQGNFISHVSSFTRTDSTTSEIADVWFANSQFYTRYLVSPGENITAYYAPNIRGSGQVADLHIAMSLDSVLATMVNDIYSSDLSNFRDFEAEAEAIVVRWAGVETVATDSRGSNVNGRHLAALEAFFGQLFVQTGGSPNPGWVAGEELERIWDNLLAGLETRLLFQSRPLAEIFSGVEYEFATDSFVGTADFDAIAANIDQNAPAATGAAAEYWQFMIQQLDLVAASLGEPGSAYESIVDSTLVQAGMSLTIVELRDAVLQIGDTGDDSLTGTTDNDLFIGETGNDYLEGGEGGDIYYFRPGDGQDSIYDADGLTNGVDVIQFAAGITPGDVTVTRGGPGNDFLYFDFAGSSDRLTVEYQFTSSMYGIEEVRFADGTVWDLAQIHQFLQNGTPGADNLYGTSGDNVLDGGAGNDYLEGRWGNDTYLFGLGYGQDRIYDSGGSLDTVELGAGIAPTDITLSRGGTGNNFLYIDIDGTSDRLTSDWQFTGSTYGIDELHFDDGTIWDEAKLLEVLQTGTPGDDNLYGTSGADTLDGGAGNDYLEGRWGNDTFVFGLGYGQDRLYDTGGADTVEFGAGIAPTDVTLSRGGTSNNFLYFDITGTTDRLTSESQYSGSSYGVEEVRFDDDTVWNEATFAAMMQTGTSGDDTLTGTAYSDMMSGLGGNDTLDGGAGHDTLDGGAGDDSLTGGLGSDSFVFRGGYGADTAEDFTAGAASDDVIDIKGMGYATLASVLAATTQVGSDAVIDFGGSDSLTLVGVDRANLHDDDFVFA